MDIQLKESKSATALVFYVPSDRLENARAALDDLKKALAKQGFVVDHVSESKTKRP